MLGAAGEGGGAAGPARTQDPWSPAGPPTDAQIKSLSVQTLDSVMALWTLRYSKGLHQPHHGAHGQAWRFAAWIWARGLLTWDVAMLAQPM